MISAALKELDNSYIELYFYGSLENIIIICIKLHFNFTAVSIIACIITDMLFLSIIMLFALNIFLVKTGANRVYCRRSCEYPWVNANHVNLGCLLFEGTTMQNDEAKKFCEDRDAHLVETLTPAQLEFVRRHMESIWLSELREETEKADYLMEDYLMVICSSCYEI